MKPFAQPPPTIAIFRIHFTKNGMDGFVDVSAKTVGEMRKKINIAQNNLGLNFHRIKNIKIEQIK